MAVRAKISFSLLSKNLIKISPSQGYAGEFLRTKREKEREKERSTRCLTASISTFSSPRRVLSNQPTPFRSSPPSPIVRCIYLSRISISVFPFCSLAQIFAPSRAKGAPAQRAAAAASRRNFIAGRFSPPRPYPPAPLVLKRCRLRAAQSNPPTAAGRGHPADCGNEPIRP